MPSRSCLRCGSDVVVRRKASVRGGLPGRKFFSELLSDPGCSFCISPFFHGLGGPEESQWFNFPIIDEHFGRSEVVGCSCFVVPAVHSDICDGKVETSLHRACRIQGDSCLCRGVGLLPLLKTDECMALVQQGIRFPELFLICLLYTSDAADE